MSGLLAAVMRAERALEGSDYQQNALSEVIHRRVEPLFRPEGEETMLGSINLEAVHILMGEEDVYYEFSDGCIRVVTVFREAFRNHFTGIIIAEKDLTGHFMSVWEIEYTENLRSTPGGESDILAYVRTTNISCSL